MASNERKRDAIRVITRWSVGDKEIIVIPNPKVAGFRESPGAASLYLNGFVKSLLQLRQWLFKGLDGCNQQESLYYFLSRQNILFFEKFSNELVLIREANHIILGEELKAILRNDQAYLNGYDMKVVYEDGATHLELTIGQALDLLINGKKGIISSVRNIEVEKLKNAVIDKIAKYMVEKYYRYSPRWGSRHGGVRGSRINVLDGPEYAMAICGRGIYERPAYACIGSKYKRVWKYVLIKTNNGHPIIEDYVTENKFSKIRKEHWKITLMLKVLVNDNREVMGIILARDEGLRARTFSIWGIGESVIIGTLWGELYLLRDYSSGSDNRRLILEMLRKNKKLIFPKKRIIYVDAELLCRGVFVPELNVNIQKESIKINANTEGLGVFLDAAFDSTHIVEVWRKEIVSDLKRLLGQLPKERRREILRLINEFHNGVIGDNGKIVRLGFKHIVRKYISNFDTHYLFSAISMQYPGKVVNVDKLPSIFSILSFMNQLIKYKIRHEESITTEIYVLRTFDSVAVSTTIRNLLILSQKYSQYLFHMSSWTQESFFNLLGMDVQKLLQMFSSVLKRISSNENYRNAIDLVLKTKSKKQKRSIENLDFTFWFNVNDKITTTFQGVLALHSVHKRYYYAIFHGLEQVFSTRERSEKIWFTYMLLKKWINLIMVAWQYDVNLLMMILRKMLVRIIRNVPDAFSSLHPETIVTFPLHYTLVQKDLRKIKNICDDIMWSKIINEYEGDMLSAGISKPKINLFTISIWYRLKYSAHKSPHILDNSIYEASTLDNAWQQVLPRSFLEDRKRIFKFFLT